MNLLINAPFITVAEAADLGVRRISVGGTLARTAWRGWLDAAQEIAEAGTFTRFEAAERRSPVPRAMMRYVESRRHTDNDGDQLSEQGVADAEALGRTGLHPPYAAFVSSGAERATEVLTILRRAAGQDEVSITTEAGLRSAVEDRWRDAAKAAGKGATVEDMRAVDPVLVDQESGCSVRVAAGGRGTAGTAAGAGGSAIAHQQARSLRTRASPGNPRQGAGILVVENEGRVEGGR